MTPGSRSRPVGISTFVDASGWVALLHSRDVNHIEAGSVYEHLLAEGSPLITTNWAAYEALSLLKSRAGPDAADAFWQILENPRLMTTVRVTEAIEALTLALFFSHRDKTWGVVDCASLVVMAQTGCRQAFGFDRHFVEASRQRGFGLVP